VIPQFFTSAQSWDDQIVRIEAAIARISGSEAQQANRLELR
jgi:hypothetical protein